MLADKKYLSISFIIVMNLFVGAMLFDENNSSLKDRFVNGIQILKNQVLKFRTFL